MAEYERAVGERPVLAQMPLEQKAALETLAILSERPMEDVDGNLELLFYVPKLTVAAVPFEVHRGMKKTEIALVDGSGQVRVVIENLAIPVGFT